MRIALDSNVFVSAVVFGSEALGQLLAYVSERHTLVLSSYVIDELARVVRTKFPGKVAAMDSILFNLSYESEYTPQRLPVHDLFKIRDPKDEKVLYSAITADCDILITGDKDFRDIDIDRPEIMTPAAFIAEYMA
ncbi:MAG: putative toxin-antitoxin system toxin component, PIN family [Oscillospiraceae bacterium]|nr:putative toxin-antitoxin system toxin component, PIN family [Oscillospiraceae bacterium]